MQGIHWKETQRNVPWLDLGGGPTDTRARKASESQQLLKFFYKLERCAEFTQTGTVENTGDEPGTQP